MFQQHLVAKISSKTNNLFFLVSTNKLTENLNTIFIIT